jgi:hypothetical protein
MPWLTDLHFLFLSRQMHPFMSRWAFPNAMADGPAFF